MEKIWKVFVKDCDSSLSSVMGDTFYVVGLNNEQEVKEFWELKHPNERMNCVTIEEIEKLPIYFVGDKFVKMKKESLKIRESYPMRSVYGNGGASYPWKTLIGKNIRPPLGGENIEDYKEYLTRWSIMNKEDVECLFNDYMIKIKYADVIINEKQAENK